MSLYPITVKPFGETAVLVEWPKEVSEVVLNDIRNFQNVLKSQLDAHWALVPAYNSITLICQHGDFNFPLLKGNLLEWYANLENTLILKRNLWKFPVCYDADFGPDLKEIADKLSISVKELIKLHTAHGYTVFGIGFLPGFMYLGGLPGNLETKRRDTPRLHVNKGSVGLAGKQTGIYPQDSPGGWNIIGRCPVPMFDPRLDVPCLVNVGDRIQFHPIDRATYNLRAIEAEVGIYKPEKEVLDAEST